MPRVKMVDTTHHRDYGAMREGTVHEVSDEDADRLVRIGVAQKTTARTTAEVERLAAEPPAEEVAPAPARQEPIAMDRDDVAGLTGSDAAPRTHRTR